MNSAKMLGFPRQMRLGWALNECSRARWRNECSHAGGGRRIVSARVLETETVQKSFGIPHHADAAGRFWVYSQCCENAGYSVHY